MTPLYSHLDDWLGLSAHVEMQDFVPVNFYFVLKLIAATLGSLRSQP